MTSSSEEHDRLREKICELESQILEHEAIVESINDEKTNMQERIDELESAINCAVQNILEECKDLDRI